MTLKLQREKAETVLHRGLSLGLLFVRFSIEFGIKGRGLIESSDLTTVEQIGHVVNSSAKIRNSLTPKELKLLTGTPIGGWDETTITQASWYSESCGCLLWAADKLAEFPRYDNPFHLLLLNTYFNKNIMNIQRWAIPFSHHTANFREIPEILYEKKRSELVFQRCVYANEIRNKGRQVPLESYEDIFHFSSVGIPIGSSGDIVVGRGEFCDLCAADERTLFTISLCRSHALTWALNSDVEWDTIDLDYLYKFSPHSA